MELQATSAAINKNNAHQSSAASHPGLGGHVQCVPVVGIEVPLALHPLVVHVGLAQLAEIVRGNDRAGHCLQNVAQNDAPHGGLLGCSIAACQLCEPGDTVGRLRQLCGGLSSLVAGKLCTDNLHPIARDVRII